jgi:UDP-3-O-[3-hydroxymyristoyl] N-acetylglucosamine deacetylase
MTTVRVLPARPGDRDRYFVRTDLPHAPVIPARIYGVRQTMLATELVQPLEPAIAQPASVEPASVEPAIAQPATVKTVEHLLAALAGAGVDAVRIEIDGPEVPLLDGSAREWCAAIASVGLAPLAGVPLHRTAPVTEPIWIREDDAFVAALPAPELRFSYGIDFALAAIGNQWHSWSPGMAAIAPLQPDAWDAPGRFAAEIAPARTFGLAHQVDQLRAAGLIQGGSLDNALVCSESGWLNPPLRFPNEPARHKILDLVGDLSLLGTIPTAHYLAYKASHRLHAQLAQRLAQTP